MHPAQPLMDDVKVLQTLDAWRFAAALVRKRWSQFLAADHTARAKTFAAYVAALDYEAEVADELRAASRSM